VIADRLLLSLCIDLELLLRDPNFDFFKTGTKKPTAIAFPILST